MTLTQIEQYAIDNISNKQTHLFNYHFNEINVRIIKHPFSTSIIQCCNFVEQRIEGYTKRFIDKLASINQKNLDSAKRHSKLVELAVYSQIKG